MSRAAIRQSLLALLFALPVAAAELPSVRVIEPADGAILTGGSTALIRWAGAVDGERGIEEWEAFLSVDGGRYYSARITPHLDAGIHEFRWTVPNVGSNDVRVLLRFGNEKDEHAIELPLALSIRPAPAPVAEPERVSRPGEAARPGDPGVTQWTEGDRHGSHVAEITTSIPGLSAVSRDRTTDRSAIETGGVALHRKPAQAVSRVAIERQAPAPPLLLAFDVLRHCCRLNI